MKIASPPQKKRLIFSPIQIHYLLEPTPDYVTAAVTTVTELHREDVPGDVLVFLTGQEEVEAAVRVLEAEAARLRGSRLKYRLLPLPLYSGAWQCQSYGAAFPAGSRALRAPAMQRPRPAPAAVRSGPGRPAPLPPPIAQGSPARSSGPRSSRRRGARARWWWRPT